MAEGRYLLGYDIGTSSIKASLLDIESGRRVASAQAPENEMEVISLRSGFAEQRPETWWAQVKAVTAKLKLQSPAGLHDIAAIGLTYQMHGLVIVDKASRPVRPAIIWCDSRAVELGEHAYRALGEETCRRQLLNSPANFTASKLRWVLENEPDLFQRVDKFMLPGDYIALMLTGEATTTSSGLSEMILWDFLNGKPAQSVLDVYEIDRELIPTLVPTFGEQGSLLKSAAMELGLKEGIPVTYRAGDQPNNAFSLRVLEPGEVAATAGTSGVIYGVSSAPVCDRFFRVNTFLHVNHAKENPRFGVLLCVNGTGILNSWSKRNIMGGEVTYDEMNHLSGLAPIGCDRLVMLPYGNGAERTLCNKNIGASIHGLELNFHNRSHLLRAAQEGIVYALFYGLEIMQKMGVQAATIRAGHANMFLSRLFCEIFASVTGAEIEIYDTDGAQGAARGAGVGGKIYKNYEEAFAGLHVVQSYQPKLADREAYQRAYARWCSVLNWELSREE